MPSEKLPPSTHAKLSASSADRWMLCPGSVRLSEGLPNTSSEYAAEGTFAHHIAAECLLYSQRADSWLGKTMEVEGYHIECGQDMVDAVNDYISEVDSYMKAGDTAYIEESLTPKLKELHPQFGGTSDLCIWRPKTKTLRVYDYKHGAGVLVNAEENRQLKYYALGALLSIGEPAETVEVAIVQPRCGSGDTVRLSAFPAFDLLDFTADLIEAAHLTEQPDAPLSPGEKQCKWCLAAAICPALEKHQAMVMADDFDVVGTDNLFMTPEKLSEALSILPLVEARISQIRELAYNEGLKGTPPPGYKIVEKRATRKWKDTEEATAWAEMMLGTEAPFTEPKLKSPAQVEKLLDKEGKKELEEMVEAISSGFTLVPVSDKRPPAMLAAPDDFDDV